MIDNVLSCSFDVDYSIGLRASNSRDVEKKCYIYFKKFYQTDDMYKEILDMTKELKQLEKMEKGKKVCVRKRGFQMIFEKAASRVRLLFY